MQKIHFVIDKSGSMANMMEDVKEGIRATLADIDECYVSVSTFSSEIYIEESVCKSTCFTMPELHCCGGTRLFDCLVQVLSKEMESAATMVVVLTDGLNNTGTSTEEDVRKLLLKFKDNNNIVKFLGANMDAIVNAAVLGVDASDALTYDGANVTNAFRAVSENIIQYQRSGVDVPFLQPQRAASIATPIPGPTQIPLHANLPDLEPPRLRRCHTFIG
jgi:hypothetical protein